MKTQGRFDIIALSNHEHFLKATHLDESKVEIGDILIAEVDCGDHYSITKLFVGPHSKVKKHEHLDNSEWYFDLDSRTAEFCALGGKHELENTGSGWSIVLSIKQW